MLSMHANPFPAKECVLLVLPYENSRKVRSQAGYHPVSCGHMESNSPRTSHDVLWEWKGSMQRQAKVEETVFNSVPHVSRMTSQVKGLKNKKKKPKVKIGEV